ncbi:MAG TPA: COX15/CtaA family protein [Xanthobacteraceae bacterium]|jgi:cytochrome c oxidase assembly protein subunit 15|nr:COX15/CtaA family protein [Xanthobacteraceae bacterium]
MTPSERHHRAIRLWLYAVAALVLAMVLVGGATRLTESGLSITEWKPVMGTLPPLSDAQWQDEFQKYQAIPQYKELNRGMSLDAFKSIYWWEWTHRLLGRSIGMVFLLPFLWFLWRGWVEPGLRGRLWIIFALGGLQGAVGWWMVASGLADRVEVSQYRLATHLILACVIYVAIVWTARRLDEPPAETDMPLRMRFGASALLVLVLLQIYLGAIVAGLRAGRIYNTWPLIDGTFVPDSSRLFFNVPLWRNFFENTLTAQFDHRMLAYVILIAAIVHAIRTTRYVVSGPAVTGAWLLAAAVVLQASLGIFALLEVVPLSLALMHQAMAMVVLTAATLHAAAVIPGPSDLPSLAPRASEGLHSPTRISA